MFSDREFKILLAFVINVIAQPTSMERSVLNFWHPLLNTGWTRVNTQNKDPSICVTAPITTNTSKFESRTERRRRKKSLKSTRTPFLLPPKTKAKKLCWFTDIAGSSERSAYHSIHFEMIFVLRWNGDAMRYSGIARVCSTARTELKLHEIWNVSNFANKEGQMGRWASCVKLHIVVMILYQCSWHSPLRLEIQLNDTPYIQ